MIAVVSVEGVLARLTPREESYGGAAHNHQGIAIVRGLVDTYSIFMVSTWDKPEHVKDWLKKQKIEYTSFLSATRAVDMLSAVKAGGQLVDLFLTADLHEHMEALTMGVGSALINVTAPTQRFLTETRVMKSWAELTAPIERAEQEGDSLGRFE